MHGIRGFDTNLSSLVLFSSLGKLLKLHLLDNYTGHGQVKCQFLIWSVLRGILPFTWSQWLLNVATRVPVFQHLYLYYSSPLNALHYFFFPFFFLVIGESLIEIEIEILIPNRSMHVPNCPL